MAAPKKVRVNEWEDVASLKHTGQVEIPADPLDRVLGQEEAINLAKIAAVQRRNLLLVGPPGTGKSMIARAISMNLPKATQEIRVAHNPENPERPFLNILTAAEVKSEENAESDAIGTLYDPKNVPPNIS